MRLSLVLILFVPFFCVIGWMAFVSVLQLLASFNKVFASEKHSIDEIDKWLSEQIYIYYRGNNPREYWFLSKQAAIHFKMRWG